MKLFIEQHLINKITEQKESGNTAPIQTWSRRSSVVPYMIGHTFAIHNGKSFVPIFITEQMVGHKLGEFAPTRKFKGHKVSDKKARR
jgi:small subunit ribosomal protein S19